MTRLRCTPEAVGYAIGVGAGRGALGALGCLLVWTLGALVANVVQFEPFSIEWGSALAYLLYACLIAGTMGAVLGGLLGLAVLPIAAALRPGRAAVIGGGAAAALVVALTLQVTGWTDPGWLLLLVPMALATALAAAWHARDLSRRAIVDRWPRREPDDGPLI